MSVSRKKIRVAMDGPVSSGKSTVGSLAAGALGYLFIDTGLMYRGLAYKISLEKVPQEEWGKTARHTRFDWDGSRDKPDLILDGMTVSGKLSSPNVASFTSRVAAYHEVREALVERQREMAKEGGVVMVGRDIGTAVLPDAELKIYLTASLEIRVERRYEEFSKLGITIEKEELKKEIAARDKRDSTRKDSPLMMPPGGVELDTTNLSIEQVVEKIVSWARMREEKS